MRLLATVLALLLVSGCGTLEYHREAQWVKTARTAGKDPDHVRSCGPDAIYDALRYLHRDILFVRDPFSKKEISKIIQARHTTACRDFVSIFDNRGRQISFVSDISAVLRHYKIGMYKLEGEDVAKVSDVKGLGVAIVLVKRKGKLDYHWITYPSNSEKRIENFYGDEDNTIVKGIYVLFKL